MNTQAPQGLDFSAPLQTRDGRKVRVYATDGGGDYPVQGTIWREWGRIWISCSWTLEGETWKGDTLSADLVPVPPPVPPSPQQTDTYETTVSVGKTYDNFDLPKGFRWKVENGKVAFRKPSLKEWFLGASRGGYVIRTTEANNPDEPRLILEKV